MAGLPPPLMNGFSGGLKRFIAKPERQNGAKMTEDKRAELYTNPGGKFIRADSLSRILAHWRSFRTTQKQTHFIKYDGEFYVGEEVDKLQLSNS